MHICVVPRHELDEGGVEGDTGVDVHNGGGRVGDEVLGDVLPETPNPPDSVKGFLPFSFSIKNKK